MPIILDGTAGIANNATDISYTGTLTGSTGVVNIGSGQVYKDASGNVGIGTSSPDSRLTVQSGGDAQLTLKNTSGTTRAYIGTAGIFSSVPTDALRIRAEVGGIVFGIAGSETARIDASGNLLVGRTTAYSDGTLGIPLFQVKGVVGAAAAAFIATTTGAISIIGFVNPNGTVGSISVNGTSTAYSTSSDYRLKNTIAPITGALAKVAALKPVTYKWNADGSDGEGFIAHELAEVCPHAVTGEKDAVDADGKPKYQGIDVSFLVATLTAAIQEQQALIQSLAQRISALEAK